MTRLSARVGRLDERLTMSYPQPGAPKGPHPIVRALRVYITGAIRKRPHRSGAIFRLRWSDDVSGARPRHVRLRVVSRFSALQKACQNIEMAANASVFRLCIGVVRPCGSCPAPAAGTAQRPGGSCPDPGRSRASSASRPNRRFLTAAERFLPRGQTVPARPDGSCQTAFRNREL